MLAWLQLACSLHSGRRADIALAHPASVLHFNPDSSCSLVVHVLDCCTEEAAAAAETHLRDAGVVFGSGLGAVVGLDAESCCKS